MQQVAVGYLRIDGVVLHSWIDFAITALIVPFIGAASPARSFCVTPAIKTSKGVGGVGAGGVGVDVQKWLVTVSHGALDDGMARSLRVEYAGAYYHVMARGNRREAIFLDEKDRHFFLKAVSEACARTGWMVHAWVVMGNHYHLFIETPEANLVEGMKWLQNTYTRRFNVRHRAWGRVFGDRYKSVVVEGELPEYYGSLVDYIHLNPVRAGIVSGRRGESVLDYPWSSLAGGYALPAGRRAKWLAAGVGLERLGYRDTAAGRKKMVEELDRRSLSEGRKSVWCGGCQCIDRGRILRIRWRKGQRGGNRSDQRTGFLTRCESLVQEAKRFRRTASVSG